MSPPSRALRCAPRPRRAKRSRRGSIDPLGTDDTIAPVGPALRVAERAPKSELFRSRGDHYGVYQGGEDYDRVIDVEVEFLHRHA
jgi:hypothetical protein